MFEEIQLQVLLEDIILVIIFCRSSFVPPSCNRVDVDWPASLVLVLGSFVTVVAVFNTEECLRVLEKEIPGAPGSDAERPRVDFGDRNRGRAKKEVDSKGSGWYLYSLRLPVRFIGKRLERTQIWIDLIA
ncbi:hypothetical protein K438DRAFT_1789928 [Mycena galopus ATCC 62051]|nr:hypothetical protein K438DRAFT_1789928 [Mycena galopus ATCC 62051]